MLKMKLEPTISMKTKGQGQEVYTFLHVFDLKSHQATPFVPFFARIWASGQVRCQKRERLEERRKRPLTGYPGNILKRKEESFEA